MSIFLGLMLLYIVFTNNTNLIHSRKTSTSLPIPAILAFCIYFHFQQNPSWYTDTSAWSDSSAQQISSTPFPPHTSKECSRADKALKPLQCLADTMQIIPSTWISFHLIPKTFLSSHHNGNLLISFKTQGTSINPMCLPQWNRGLFTLQEQKKVTDKSDFCLRNPKSGPKYRS